MARLTLEEKGQILTLKKEGMTSREISHYLWGVDSRKSTVNDYLAEQIVEEHYSPRVCLIDIETSPEVSYHFGRFKVNISQDMNIETSKVLGFAYKWLGEDEVHTVYPKKHPAYLYDSAQEEVLIEEAHDVLSQADFVIGHNVDRFDVPVLNARMLYYGMRKPAPYKTIDTLKIAKQEFRFPQNRLDVLGAYLGVGRKVEHEGFKLWRKCMEGDAKAWNDMEVYNVQDVVLLEEVFLQMRGWTPRLPNISLYYPNAIPRCPACGGSHLTVHKKMAYTQVSTFNLYQCEDCGGWSRGRTNNKSKDQRANILTTVR